MGEEKKAFSVREIDEGSDDQKGAQSMGADKAALSENFASEGNFDAEYSARILTAKMPSLRVARIPRLRAIKIPRLMQKILRAKIPRTPALKI